MDGLAILKEDVNDLACGEEVAFLPFSIGL